MECLVARGDAKVHVEEDVRSSIEKGYMSFPAQGVEFKFQPDLRSLIYGGRGWSRDIGSDRVEENGAKSILKNH